MIRRLILAAFLALFCFGTAEAAYNPNLQGYPVNVLTFSTAANPCDPTGSADSTVCLQAALNAVNAQIVIPPGNYKISSGLSMTLSASLYMMPGSSIIPTGSGYTALTINNVNYEGSGHWRLDINQGNGSFTGNGLAWVNPVNIVVDQITVRGIVGNAVSLTALIDAFISRIDVVSCGSSSLYAFSIGPIGPGKSGDFAIGSLNVVSSAQYAIDIDPSTTHWFIGEIHEEQTADVVSTDAIILGGEGTIGVAKFAPTNGVGNIKLGYSALPAVFNNLNFITPGPILVSGAGPITLINPTSNANTLTQVDGVMNIYGGILTNFTRPSNATSSLRDVTIGGTYTEGFTGSPDRAAALLNLCDNCNIATLTASDNSAVGYFKSSQISAVSYAAGKQFNYLILEDDAITGDLVFSKTNIVEIRGVTTIGNLEADGSGAQVWVSNTSISGNLAGNGTGSNGVCANSLTVGGTVASQFLSAPTVGTWANGQRCDYITPTSSDPAGYAFNGSAWKSLANVQ